MSKSFVDELYDALLEVENHWLFALGVLLFTASIAGGVLFLVYLYTRQ